MLSRSVLLLNQNYEPLSVCDAKKAIILIFLQKAEVVEHADEWIRSVYTKMRLPSVIRLKRYARSPQRRILLNRRNLLIRDNYRCQYCGRTSPPLTMDHIIPKQVGGKDTWENLVIACLPCNNRKGNKTPEQAGMHLMSTPKKPNHYFYFQHFFGCKDDLWKPYLFLK